MPDKQNRDKQKVQDVLTAIGLIFSFVADKDFKAFLKSDLLQSGVIRQLEIIGEASNKISEKLKTDHPNIEWRSIKAFRNLLIHEYFKVDAAEVWATIETDLPLLKEQMQHILITL